MILNLILKVGFSSSDFTTMKKKSVHDLSLYSEEGHAAWRLGFQGLSKGVQPSNDLNSEERAYVLGSMSIARATV